MRFQTIRFDKIAVSIVNHFKLNGMVGDIDNPFKNRIRITVK